jgi:uncharacterized Zn finger protein
MYDDDYEWPAYVSVAEKRKAAERLLAKLRKQGKSVAPVKIEGQKIATTFWGKSWCTNLERYSDYATRVPRGRSYVRNGCVLDLQVKKGQVVALVSGSELYEIKITIAPVAAAHWKAICRDCAGAIDTVVELLQGRIAKSVMDRVCREGDGLFPSPKQIKLSCDCPDSASMCKHIAAALYGVGARLDEKPQLLFVLRGVDENELLANAGKELALTSTAPGAARILGDSDVAALFGLEMAETDDSGPVTPAASKRHQDSAKSKNRKVVKMAAAKKSKSPDATREKAGRKKTISASVVKQATRSRPRTFA